MKIGFFTDAYFPEIDGVTYTLKLWRDRLEAAGHDVWIVYPDGDYEPDERELPIKSLPNPFYRGYRVALFRRLSKLPDFDVVHCHGPGPVGLLGLYCARRRDIPSVYTHHTPVEEYFHQSVKSQRLAGLLSDVYVPFENHLLDQFDVVTASTPQINRNVDPIELPVGVDMEFFTPRETPATDGGALIGYSGRVSMEKNVEEILSVARTLSACNFVVVGEGPRREALEGEAPDNVTFRDFLPREELPRFYSALDAFVTASTADTLGLATLEANACRTPVAAADVAPFSRTIGPENGTRFEYGDKKGMADAIETCLFQEWETRAAVEQYSAHRTISELESIYNRLRTDQRVTVPQVSRSSATHD
jgi:glycosyltransferase involved in cell wall biosynthesis